MDLLNFTGKGASGQLDSGPRPRPPTQDRTLPGGRRDMGPAAAHKGNAHFHSLGGPLGNLQSVKKTKVTWAGPEKGIGEVGKQAEAGLGACG